MDFILTPTTPADGIQWEKVLPPLIPRLNGTYGQYNWSPKLLIAETENVSSANVSNGEIIVSTLCPSFKNLFLLITA